MTPRWITGALCLVNDGGWRTQAADIELAEGRILALHARGTADSRILDRAAAEGAVLDASRMLAIPGLINAHFHSPDQLIRGSAPDLPLEFSTICGCRPTSIARGWKWRLALTRPQGRAPWLRSGLAADITLLRPDSPSFVPLHDAVCQLVQGETGAASAR